jgi:hypothetical protein
MLNDLKRAWVSHANPSRVLSARWCEIWTRHLNKNQIINPIKKKKDLGAVFPPSLLLLRLIGVFSVSPTRLISRSTGAHCWHMPNAWTNGANKLWAKVRREMNNLLLNWTAINDWLGASNIKSSLHGRSQPFLCKNPPPPLLPPQTPPPPPPPPTTQHTHTLSLSPHFSTYTHSPVSISSLLLTTTGPFSPLPSPLAFCLLVVHKLGALGFWKLASHSFF